MTRSNKPAPSHEELVERMEREPFNLLEWVLHKGLAQLEQALTRLVWAVGRKDAG